MEFLSNATDVDAYNLSTDLLPIVILKSYLTNATIEANMTYNSTIHAWNLTWNIPASADLGNYSVNFTVKDETGQFNSTLLPFNITILNNHPGILILEFIPSDYKLLQNEIIRIHVNFTDLEGLKSYTVKIQDYYGNWKNKTSTSISSTVVSLYINLDPDFYNSLVFDKDWVIYIIVVDLDDGIVNQTVLIHVYPQKSPPPPIEFPWELVVIFGLVITAVLASLLVYRFRKREEEEVPVTRVKALIKKIAEERKAEEEKEDQAIAEYEKSQLLKKHVKTDKSKEEKPKAKFEEKDLNKLERKNIEVSLSEALTNARDAMKRSNYKYAGELYQKAAKYASKLGDISKSTRFSEQAESCFKKARKSK